MTRYLLLLLILPLVCFCDLTKQDSSVITDSSKVTPPANFIFVISPYRYEGTWVFDDPRVGLVREPFVAGIPEMIDKLVEDIPDAENGFRLFFSIAPFPGYTTKLVWRRAEHGGNWYYCEKYGSEGWLCPALFKYFDTTPKEIFAKAEKK